MKQVVTITVECDSTEELHEFLDNLDAYIKTYIRHPASFDVQIH